MTKNPQALTSACCKPAGRPKASDLEARTFELIHTSGKLFLKHGYSKVSLEMIAREAHVAVRTIYVKFGGKAGLLSAVLEHKRDRFFKLHDMESDNRPPRDVLREFALHFQDLISSPEALSMQRMVIAEAPGNPELARTFYEAGPKRTRAMLASYFDRPEVRAQLRPDADAEALSVNLLNCLMGDQFARFLFDPVPRTPHEIERLIEQRLSLFFDGALLRA